MKPKLTNKIVILSALLTLVFSAVGVVPTQALGPFSHNEIVRQAYNLLPASDLKTLLSDYQGAVLAGSVFPDWAMVGGTDLNPDTARYYNDLSEFAHWPEFTAGYINYIRTHYQEPYSPEAKESIAFLFGIISHNTADPLFHYDFMPYAYDIDPDVATHTQVEWDVDVFNIYHCGGLGCAALYNNVDWASGVHQSNAIKAAYDEMYASGVTWFSLANVRDFGLGWGEYLGWSNKQVQQEGSFMNYGISMLARPNGYTKFWNYHPGGMADGAQHTANAWLATWEILNDDGYTGINHVKPNGSDTANCHSWGEACSLQRALGHSVPGMEIWVAEGTYKPTTGSDRKVSFELPPYVKVYGGFPNSGNPSFADHDPVAYPTTLSGDLNEDDDPVNIAYDDPSRDDNSYHVVIGLDGATLLDGFIVTGGNANGASLNSSGGGWDSGGGMYNNHVGSRLTVENVIFKNNSATNRGGGMYNFGYSNPTITNVTFEENTANKGGGMFNLSASPKVQNVTFMGNIAFSLGGGVYNQDGAPEFTNVTLSGNLAVVDGGGMANELDELNISTGSSCAPVLKNVTFNGNHATLRRGGGLFNHACDTEVYNTIFWNNTAVDPYTESIYHEVSEYSDGIREYIGNFTIGNSVVQGSAEGLNSVVPGIYSGTGNLNTDPKLGQLGNYGGFTPTIPLLSGSSAINAGVSCPTRDQRGMRRIEACDIGAYEYGGVGPFLVTPNGVATGNCQSWSNACTLQQALSMSVSGDEIWVKKGLHLPTTGTDRTVTFQLKTGVAVYGGFAGWETSRDKRNPASNTTILSGDIDNNDSNSDGNNIAEKPSDIQGNNSYHVVVGANNATLDGFIVTGGNANGSDS